jgi:hypothetical protein
MESGFEIPPVSAMSESVPKGASRSWPGLIPATNLFGEANETSLS